MHRVTFKKVESDTQIVANTELVTVCEEGLCFPQVAESILSLANKHGINQQRVRQVLASAILPEPQDKGRQQPRIGPGERFHRPLSGRTPEALRRHRHAAMRIWSWLRNEHPQRPATESTVRQYVQNAKRVLGQTPGEIYMPQT